MIKFSVILMTNDVVSAVGESYDRPALITLSLSLLHAVFMVIFFKLWSWMYVEYSFA